jgi:AcrR family transcriptional regulator
VSEILVLINIDRRRRADIGRERRARNRARILEAARTLFTSEPIASVTVDDVMRQARLSRGAFYSHFRSLDELWASVALDVASAVRRFGRTGVVAADPVARIAAGCAAFIDEAQRDPDWGALFARGVSAFPIVANAARERLTESLRLAEGEGRLTPFSLEVGFDLVFGAVLEAMRLASDARLSPRDVPDIVGGILRALGVPASEVELALRQLDHETTQKRDAASESITN